MQNYTTIIMIVLMIVAFYFLIIRPQRKRAQQQQDMVRKLEPGSRVVTTTGIYATIVAMGDKQVVLETSPGSRVTMLKQAIGRVVTAEEEDAELAAYRGTGAPGQQAGPGQPGQQADFGDQPEQPSSSASGLAGGAPIQEYTPGSGYTGPGFEAPSQQTDPYQQTGLSGSEQGEPTEQHQTAPWPPQGSQPQTGQPGEDEGRTGGSVLGESSLSYEEQRRDEEGDGGRSGDQK